MHVAVWMTNYASEEFLPAAIQSVLSQSHGELTLYIADNHSPGEARSIIERFASRDKRIVVLDVPEGLAGIPLMKFVWDHLNTTAQDYTITLGGHDLWEKPEFLETMVSRITHEVYKKTAIVFPDTWQLNAKNEICSHYSDIMQVANQAYALVPQYVISGVSSPHLFGLWDESVRRRVPFRHCCSGWDHLIVAEAALYGTIVFEPRVKLMMRAPAADDDLVKYGKRHLSALQLASRQKDFLEQLEWMIHSLDIALESLPAANKTLYKMMLTSSMVGTYIALRGVNLFTVPGAMEAFNQLPEVQQIFGAATHIDKTVRQLVRPVTV